MHDTPDTQDHARIDALVSEALAECGDDERRLFDYLRIPVTPVPVERAGDQATGFAILRGGARLVFWDDRTQGFDVGIPDADGIVRTTTPGDFALAEVMEHMLETFE